MDSLSFFGFPEDVQLCILSFLTPSELAAFACTSKGFVSLCRCDAKVWFSLCDRRWGSKTHISKWGNGKIAYKQLYQTLTEYENLIGFWRKSGQSNNGGALNLRPLVFFEWGTSFITASTVYPSTKGTYQVKKAPFLWLSITPDGMPVSFLDPVGSRSELFNDLVFSGVLGFIENGFVPVDVTFMGKTHVAVKENLNFGYSNSLSENIIGTGRIGSSGNLSGGEESEMESGTPQQGTVGSLPDRLVSEIYQYFANRTSPGGSGDRAARRQMRREKERRKLEAEYLVKIVNSSATPSRPLQGLWKGICDDMNLDFYLITYDDIGKIGCRRIGGSSQLPSGYCPLFWTRNTTFIEPPFSREEEYLYDSRLHLQPWVENKVVSRILYISSYYDLINRDLARVSAKPRHVEGRIWQYGNGTIGFGFLGDNCIIDLRHVALDGCILDTI